MMAHHATGRISTRDVKFIVVSDIPQEPPGPNRLPLLPGEPDPDAVFARCLRAAREAAGLTQKQLADHMTGRGYQMRQGTISKIEAAERFVWLGEAISLAEAVGASLTDLLTPPPEPGDLAKAIAERAGYRRRRNQAFSQVEQLKEQLAVARRDFREASAAFEAAELEVESLMRRKGVVTE